LDTLNAIGLRISANGEEDKEVFQAGGHGEIKRSNPGCIGKKTIPAECEFYSKFQENTEILHHIKQYFPRVIEIRDIGHLKLEDLTHGYNKPCVMDIKMGTRSYGEDANPMKKSYMLSQDKSTTSYKFGLRIIGLRTYHKPTSQYISLTRSAANSICLRDQLEKRLLDFFHNGYHLRSDVINHFVEKLEILLSWMETQQLFRFYSSSLLFVFEGDGEVLKADVRMIDFAHVFPIKDGGIDDGYVKGLTTLIACLKKFTSGDDHPNTK